MKHTIKYMILLTALLLGVVNEAQATLSEDSIKIVKLPAGNTSTVTVKGFDVRKVTITISPAAGFYVNKTDIVVEKLAYLPPSASSAPRRAVPMAEPIPLESGPDVNGSTGDYVFTVPEGYAGAQVTVTFSAKTAATATVKANDLTYNQAAQPLVIETADGCTVQYKVDDDATFTDGVPTKTNVKRTSGEVGKYKVYYQLVPDAQHTAAAFDATNDFVEVEMKPAKLTKVTLIETVKQTTGAELTFGIKEVKAGNLIVPADGYTIKNNSNKASAEGSHTVTVTGTGNYTGETSTVFSIVGTSVVIVTSAMAPISSDADNLTKTYILGEDVPASVFENLKSGVFTGTLDGDMYTISGLSHPLFATATGATIKNVMFSGVGIKQDGQVGAVACVANGATRIYNVGILDGSVESSGSSQADNSTDCCGGLVGLLDGEARVINCFSYANIAGGNRVGGIVGYNNVATTSANLKTMVMNCMFYGDITGGTNKAPIYNGTNIVNKGSTGVGNYNYFWGGASYVQNQKIDTYNCALMAETRFLQRFEFFRHLLNSHRELAAWWATGSTVNKDQMMKWVLEPSQIGTSIPYPILKTPDYYPSVVNIDAENAPTTTERNKGGKLGTLSVTIRMGNGEQFDAPTGASITTPSLTLNITDKDPEHFNFNYAKVQLPYYNSVGTKNYTGNRVVTGWKIVSITGGTKGVFSTTGSDATTDDNGNITEAPYNFADRSCTDKDLYSVSGRVFNQGAYWDVPKGVTAITIEPYWAKAAYLADANADVVYQSGSGDKAMNTAVNVPIVGGGTIYTNGSTYNIAGEDQVVYTASDNARNALGLNKTYTVYDYAIVLVGNFHKIGITSNSADHPYTIMSADFDGDNEPDYSYILRFNGRSQTHPVRVDFLNIPGLGMAQKSTGETGTYNLGIMQPIGWFESTNTSLFCVTQFEYDRSNRIAAPYIVQGGVFEQWVNGQDGGATNLFTYFHVGGNVWFKEFHRGTHIDKTLTSIHPPVSVTGGDYDEFYLTGLYKAVTKTNDDAECYINGGRFGIVAGTGMEGIGDDNNNANTKGNIVWQIQNADIGEFYGGGINAASRVGGNITTVITDSHVRQFCGGPKFGDMYPGKTVMTTATDCEFDTYFGAGYGGNSYSIYPPTNKTNTVGDYGKNAWNTFVEDNYKQEYKDESTKNPAYKGVSTEFYYQYLPQSDNYRNVERIFVKFVVFSLAKTYDVTSTLTGCTVNGNFYGGGSLGKVAGSTTSTLNKCTMKRNVFGAGFSASLPTVEVDSIGFRKAPFYDQNLGSYLPAEKGPTTTYTWEHATTVNKTDNAIDKNNHILYTTEDLTTLGTVEGTVTLNINEGTTVAGSVFGGGESSNVALATGASDTKNVIVNINGGSMKNVYGGGSMANVGGDTEVNLMGGTISGNVFGGGKGDDGHSATVGNTLVKLNEPVVDEKGEKTYPYDCEVKGNIFGCNDVNGTPLGNASVFIYKTAGGSVTKKADLDNETATHSYQLKAVYGGGNLAAYIPSAANMETATTRVVIDGCDMTSIQQVYGGGNAASTPATKVEVLGTYEIEEVFGGGNGKDDITVGSETKRNPGANVGYESYALYDDDGSVTEKSDAKTVADRKAYYQYGSGKASVNIYGGLVHRVFGGSNTLGNVREVAVTLLDGQETCDFQIDEAYGGGKSAPMDGAAQLVMACIPGLKAAYGGAEEADINDDVTLNITNGTFDRVFGGNNVQGTIRGKITVNIEETGCHPIIIKQLYGGGNQAPYKATNPADGPTLNIKSFTSIGDVYGGGYGKTAKVTGDTHVNINVGLGDFAGQDVDEDLMGPDKPITFTEYLRKTDVEETDEQYGAFIMKKDEHGDDTNERDYQTPTIYVTLPLHEPNRIGAIQNVFGGGNQAKVVGSTYVNIGTEDSVILETKTDNTKEGEDKRVVLEVKGADIRGNVYGGGNQAEVTGSTNVVIGKKAAE